jgi:hypothetical protein
MCNKFEEQMICPSFYNKYHYLQTKLLAKAGSFAKGTMGSAISYHKDSGLTNK